MSIANPPKNSSTPQSENATVRPKRSLSNLLTRLATGMAVLPLMIFSAFMGGWWLTVPIGVLMLIGIIEFYFMERRHGQQNNVIMGVVAGLAVLLAFHWREPLLWQGALLVTLLLTFVLEFVRGGTLRSSLRRTMTTLGGLFYIAFPMAFIIAIRQVETTGLFWFFTVIYATWGTDTLAYLFGKMFGRTPFFPRLSPKKTLEGAIGGFIFGALLPMLVLIRGDILTPSAIVLCLIAPFAATAGDLFESGVKRFFGIKDSHVPGLNLLPGHGGVLDRIDSMIWVNCLVYAYLLLFGLLPPLI